MLLVTIQQQEINKSIFNFFKVLAVFINLLLCQFYICFKLNICGTILIIKKSPAGCFKQLIDFDSGLCLFSFHNSTPVLVPYQPIRHIYYLYTLVLICLLTGTGKNHLRIGILDFQQGIDLALESVGIIDAACNLNIQLLAALDGYEVDLFFIEHSGIQLIAPAKQLNGNDVLYHSAVIGVFRAQLGVFEGMITEIILIVRGKVALSLDVVSPYFVECESVAEILDICADGAVIRFDLLAGEGCRNAAGGGLIGDVVNEKVAQALHQRHIAHTVLSLNIPDDQRIKNIGNIIVFRLWRLIEVRAGHAALLDIAIKGSILVCQLEILHEFIERKGENLNFKGASGEQRCQIAA